MLKIPYVVAISLILSSCTLSKALEPPLLPADLLAACPDLPAFTGSTYDYLLQDDVRLAGLYKSCQLRHNNLSELLNGERN